MKPIKIIVVTILVLVVFVASLLIVGQLNTGATLRLRNDTHLPMKGVSVDLAGYGEATDLVDIEPGGELKVRFKEYGDSSWGVRVQDHGGRPLYEQTGYVTNGLNFTDTLTLDRTGKWNIDSTSWSLLPPPFSF
jgi:hypothetical protein